MSPCKERNKHCCCEISRQPSIKTQRGVIAARAEGIGGTNKNVDKFFTEELKQIADRDPLHDLTIQVA